jgi:hypothetical protein
MMVANKIVGIDPGGTTGLVIYDHNEKSWKGMELVGEHYQALHNTLHDAEPDVIVCERFDYRPKQGSVDLDPVEYIGVIKLYCQQFNVPAHYQDQLKGHKGLWTNDKLKVLGLYVPGKGHAMDAMRQVLYYLTVARNNMYWVNKYKELCGDGN